MRFAQRATGIRNAFRTNERKKSERSEVILGSLTDATAAEHFGLSALAAKYESQYSRYADDITFSGNHDIKSIKKAVVEIVEDEGFRLNAKKTRIAYPHQRQEVTGLLVNGDKLRVSKKYKKDLYQELYFCVKYGVKDHMQRVNCNKAFYKEHVYGKIFFVNMVEPDEAKIMFEIASKIDWDY